MKEKYGVAQDPEIVKTASTQKGCPKCGGKVTVSGSGTRHCEKCGTEPFDKKET